MNWGREGGKTRKLSVGSKRAARGQGGGAGGAGGAEGGNVGKRGRRAQHRRVGSIFSVCVDSHTNNDARYLHNNEGRQFCRCLT